MKYLPTAFGQLAFAWKLYNYGLDGKINVEELDSDVTWIEGNMVFVVPKAFGGPEDLRVALENNLTIAFGAAAITLNRTREKKKISLPDPISTAQDQCVALIYQIRNAFAHDIAEPKWQIKSRYQRKYVFDRIDVDLTSNDGKDFTYESLGGPDVIFRIKEYFEREFLQN